MPIGLLNNMLQPEENRYLDDVWCLMIYYLLFILQRYYVLALYRRSIQSRFSFHKIATTRQINNTNTHGWIVIDCHIYELQNNGFVAYFPMHHVLHHDITSLEDIDQGLYSKNISLSPDLWKLMGREDCLNPA